MSFNLLYIYVYSIIELLLTFNCFYENLYLVLRQELLNLTTHW